MSKFLYTPSGIAESVSIGHPDKFMDYIADGIVDEALRQDPNSRVAIDGIIKGSQIDLCGEITSKASFINFYKIVRDALEKVDYCQEQCGISKTKFSINSLITNQSLDIARGIDTSDSGSQGAGDQGIMFGFACTETPELMPLPILLARRLTERITYLRENNVINYNKLNVLRPDAKSLVIIKYDTYFKPSNIDTIVIAAQHIPEIPQNILEDKIRSEVITQVIEEFEDFKLVNGLNNIRIIINGTGRFVQGGPVADAGQVGRKVVVDHYGGAARVGGGAFSGKDPSKVDRSGAYAARYAAKNVVAAGLAERCELEVGYVIGKADPLIVEANTYGTGKIPDERLSGIIKEAFPWRPREIIEELNLKKPIYQATVLKGHFGNHQTEEGNFSWERTDKVNKLLSEAKVL